MAFRVRGTASNYERDWFVLVRTEGRRPLLIHTDEISDDDDVRGFVGDRSNLHRLSPPELNTIDQVAYSVARKDINITLRCNLNPEIHPTLRGG